MQGAKEQNERDMAALEEKTKNQISDHQRQCEIKMAQNDENHRVEV